MGEVFFAQSGGADFFLRSLFAAGERAYLIVLREAALRLVRLNWLLILLDNALVLR